MVKKTSIICLIMILIVGILCGCNKKAEDTKNDEIMMDHSSVSNEIQESSTEMISEPATNGVTESTVKESTTNKTTEQETDKKQPVKTSDTKTTTKSKSQSKPKKESQQHVETTTKKLVTTTTTTTTQPVKHVSPYDVQKTVNAYIKSKGATIDSSLKPIDHGGYAGYYVPTSGCQEGLDDGTTLRDLKDCVDYTIQMCGLQKMYCFYNTENHDFYVLYT